jgi:hypothetical protein
LLSGRAKTRTNVTLSANFICLSESDAESDAHFVDLLLIANRWPSLTMEMRAKILKLVAALSR